MTSSSRTFLRVAAVCCLLSFSAVLVFAERGISPQSDASHAVDLFEAMDAKDIEVKLIPRDDTESRIMIKNNTNQPLTVKLPEAFAGVPVLAQRVGGLGGGARGGGGAGNATQGVGGGFGGGGGGFGGGGGGGGGLGGGQFSVPADKVAQFKVSTVCLEHGKKEPRANVPYEIKPIEALSSKPEVKQLLVAFAQGKLNQRATQAAAWHLANDMTWEQLAAKRIEHVDGSSDPWFSPQEVQAGMQIARHAENETRLQAQKSPGKSSSLNTPSTQATGRK